MSYTSTTIASTLERINKDLCIPAIQRPYVWEAEQIMRRFHSLMQRYPISSLLFWQLDAESRHHLPPDRGLYHLNRLFELSQARREILRAPILGLWRDEANKADQALSAATGQLSVEALETA